jgi:alpha/beta superfamily hydrolase
MKKYVVFVLLLFVSVMLISCAPPIQTYDFTLYNSNDGTCSISGKSFDFYVNDEKVATIAAGEHKTLKLTEGQYFFNVKLEGTNEYHYDGWSTNIPGGTWYRAGCNDGTYPES